MSLKPASKRTLCFACQKPTKDPVLLFDRATTAVALVCRDCLASFDEQENTHG